MNLEILGPGILAKWEKTKDSRKMDKITLHKV
jgi:hypothetical protein